MLLQREHLMKLFTFVVFLSILQLNNYSDSILVKIVPLMFYAFFCFKYTFLKQNWAFIDITKRHFSFFLFLCVIFIGLIRDNNPDLTVISLINRALSTALLMVGISSALNYFSIKKGYNIIDHVVQFVIKPFTLYALLNIILWVLNIKVKESIITGTVSSSQAVVLSYFGINIDRVEFALSGGFNNYAVIVGALLTICLFLIFVIPVKKYKLFIVFSTFTFLMTLLLIDSRSSIFFPVLITIFFRYFKDKDFTLRLVPYSTLLIVLGPILMTIIMPLLAQTPLIGSLSRSSEDFATGNSRFLIWAFSLSEFINFKSIHIIGYGPYGAFISGVSSQWASIFNSWENNEMISPHSTAFGLLFDYGYIGLISYLLIIYHTLKKACALVKINTALVLLTGFFIYTIFIGITETVSGFYFPSFFILFTLLLQVGYNEFMLINRMKNQITNI